MAEQMIWYAEKIDLNNLFSNDKVLESIFISKKKSFRKGEYIYLPDENSDKVYFIISGKVKLGTYSEDDKEVVTAILQNGDVFGETSILGDQKRKDFALTNADTSLYILSMDELRLLMKDNTSLSILVMKMMGERVMEMEGRLESLVFKDSKTRIVEFLLKSIQKNGQRMGYDWILRNPITHQDIANLTATSRQTVTMVLNELRNDSIIQFDRKRLLVNDLEKLKSLAE